VVKERETVDSLKPYKVFKLPFMIDARAARKEPGSHGEKLSIRDRRKRLARRPFANASGRELRGFGFYRAQPASFSNGKFETSVRFQGPEKIKVRVLEQPSLSWAGGGLVAGVAGVVSEIAQVCAPDSKRSAKGN
jgi:hypothetical protein